MADFHKIHSKIWTDSWFYELETHEQLFFIYLFSNSRATIAGIYELPMPVMAAECKLAPDVIRAAFVRFEEAGKAYYEDGVVWVKNLRAYHETPSPQLQKGIQKEVGRVRDCALKQRYMAYYGDWEESKKEPAPEDTDRGRQNEPQDIPFERDLDDMDRVSIGYDDRPSLVLYKSKSSNTARAKKMPSPADLRVQAVVDVCGLDASVPSHRNQAEWAAAQLDAYTAEDIWARYSRQDRPPDDWYWYRDDFRGRKGELPTPKWVIENISKVVYREAGNGDAETAWNHVEQAIKKSDGRPLKELPRVWAAIENLGGWLTFKGAGEKQIPFKRQEFIKEYANVRV